MGYSHTGCESNSESLSPRCTGLRIQGAPSTQCGVLRCRIPSMYRVFESLDELVQHLEQASGFPMTSNCLVPRHEMLALLDDLRNALPVEIDDAQDVLDKQEEIIRGAEERADNTINEANAQATDMVNQARQEADTTIAQAEEHAQRLMADAEARAQSTVEQARADADRTIAQANEEYERSVAEGRQEQERLVSESEVVRRANEEANRIVETAYTESNRLRTECDDFVDSKLSEFESSLSGLLRTVNSDRSALRGGAGVRSRGGDYLPSTNAGSSRGGASAPRYGDDDGYERRYTER